MSLPPHIVVQILQGDYSLTSQPHQGPLMHSFRLYLVENDYSTIYYDSVQAQVVSISYLLMMPAGFHRMDAPLSYTGL